MGLLMVRRNRIALTFLILLAVIAAGLFVLCRHCPETGIAFSGKRRNFYRLKNRTALPQLTDFDQNITLERIQAPGEDSTRWSTTRAARLDGYVLAVGAAGVELANCYLPCSRDTHINLALQPNATAREQVVLEVTPRMRSRAREQGHDWSDEALRRELTGHWVHFEGWLLFDWIHAAESENTAPRVPGNWRATAWEIHPVTSFQVIR